MFPLVADITGTIESEERDDVSPRTHSKSHLEE